MSEDIVTALSQELDPKRVATRRGSNSQQLSYLEGYDVIDTLNRIFGYGGWFKQIMQYPQLVAEMEDGSQVYEAGVQVTVYIGEKDRMATYEDNGIGLARKPRNGNITVEHIEMGRKEATTDAMKRAARHLGNQFGNSLYDKDSPLHQSNQQPAPSGNTHHCEACEREIKDSHKYTADQKAQFSRNANNGRVLCWDCARKGK